LRRRSNLWLLAAVVTLGIAIGVNALAGTCGGDGEAQPPAPTPTLAVALPAIEPDAVLLEPAEVLRIIDGDTIQVRIDGETERVRYYGIDTPEEGDDCYDEASDRNEALAGEVVLLLPDARDRDAFDRLLRYVFTAGGESIDARLIAEGLARAWTDDGTYRDQLVALEGEARAEGVGCLWE
jgi:micrococcal nuclease